MSLNFNIISFLLFTIAIVLIFEGMLYAAFPSLFKKVMERFISYNNDRIRLLGLSFLGIGLILIYLLIRFLV